MSNLVKFIRKRLWFVVLGFLACLVCVALFSILRSPSPVPVFTFMQASPNGMTVEALVPSGLVEKRGSLEKVMQSLPSSSKFEIVQFGKSLGQFQTNSLSSSNALGAIAIFKLQTALAKNSPLWRQPNLVLIPSDQVKKTRNQSYQYTCPAKVQPLIISKSRPLFAKLGVDAARLGQIAIASRVCLDINQDQNPEIVAGLRLDNLNRPEGIDPRTWRSFLSLPPIQRQEYSMLVLLQRNGAEDWQAQSIITHTRALAYFGDSISSYAVFGAQDLNGDNWLELIVQEIGLDSVDVKVVSPSPQWTWQSYYQQSQSLDIVQ